MTQNQFTDLERLEVVAKRIRESQIDLTAQYADWVNITLACASLGESAREAYHTICSVYPKYDRKECDEKFDHCLKSGRGLVSLGTLMQSAKDAGVDIRMPSGRRPQSERQSREKQEEEQRNRMAQMAEKLREQAEWRYNTWRQRPEVRESGQDWRPVQDRDLDTFYCRLLNSGLKVKQQDVKAMIFSRDFCPDYDVFAEWLNSLKPWNPDADPDYLHDFYVGHMEFNDPENEDFYDRMFKKWHVGLVALILDRTNENPMMPILKGKQHIGKTFFARHILPPSLRDYRLEVGPSERLDKDFVISLSETPFIIFDEISFGSAQKNEAFKYIVTSSRSNVRDAYARFRESRKRRASLIATTNEDNFIRNAEGSRRYLVVDLKDTVDLENFPLPYEGAFAQALYLLDHGYQPKPDQEESLLISQHNSLYIEPNDCEEVLKTFLRKPEKEENGIALSAGDILTELGDMGHRGRSFNTSEIGKAMKRMGFESRRIGGYTKYLVVMTDRHVRQKENEADSREFVPDVF